MAIKVALLSGKGGSGKTTISLSLSSLLSICGIKVTLIDCDLATCGATYFFEKNYTKNYFNLYSLDFRDTMYEVSEYFKFVPVSTHFPCLFDIAKVIDNFVELIDRLETYSDVVIFDCQAGYSEILNSILAITDINLIIMEPDPISASAVRVLYARTSEYLESRNTYQIFSKVPEGEVHAYKKPSISMFSCLEPIRFSWDIRNAIGLLKIPELLEENMDFGMVLYGLAKFICPDYSNELSVYGEEIDLIKSHQIELELENVKQQAVALGERLKTKKEEVGLNAFVCSILFTAAIIIINTLFSLDLVKDNNVIHIAIIFIICIMSFGLLFRLLYGAEKRKLYKRQRELTLKRSNLYKMLDEIQNKKNKKLYNSEK